MAGIDFSIPDIGKFFYDSYTNKIYTVDKEPIPKEWYTREMKTIQWYYDFKYLEEKQKRGLTSLVLQVTRACNLRCSYCAYSGDFIGMLPHANEDMSSQTIKKSIDYFMKHNLDTPEPIIIFYGGEPLLRFELIQMAVQYVETYNRKVIFGISSNGTLLTPEVISWLSNHPNVHITVTVNGPKHDLLRKTINGEGSLSVICKHFDYIQQYFPNVWMKQIRQISNIDSPNDIVLLRDFYKNILHRIPVMITKIVFSGVNKAKQATNFDSEMNDIVAKELEVEYVNCADPFLDCLFDENINMIHNRHLFEDDSPGFLGSCLPAAGRLFVRTDGTFNMCEKVSDCLNLGSVWSGFDMEAIRNLYIGAVDFAQRNCRGCWAQRLCKICYQDMLNGEGLFFEKMDEEWCKKSRKAILHHLIIYVTMAVKKPERFE